MGILALKLLYDAANKGNKRYTRGSSEQKNNGNELEYPSEFHLSASSHARICHSRNDSRNKKS